MSLARRRQLRRLNQRRGQGAGAISFSRSNGNFHWLRLHDPIDDDATRILSETVQDFTGILCSPVAIRKDDFRIPVEFVHDKFRLGEIAIFQNIGIAIRERKAGKAYCIRKCDGAARSADEYIGTGEVTILQRQFGTSIGNIKSVIIICKAERTTLHGERATGFYVNADDFTQFGS